MRVAVKRYRLQAESNSLFLQKHPSSATSWEMPEVLKLIRDLQIEKTVAHMCRYGMKRSDESGGGRATKPKDFPIN